MLIAISMVYGRLKSNKTFYNIGYFNLWKAAGNSEYGPAAFDFKE